MATKTDPTLTQPISKVQWVARDELSANDWNPNKQAPPETRLLRLSILENGWTQPIVVRSEDDRLEIVDGYHRWTVAADPKIASLTGGLVPVVIIEAKDELARLATVRHNRARGTHHVLRMADLVADLHERGMADEEIARRLGMDAEEVDRLNDRGQMTKRGAKDGYNNGWTV